MSVKINTSYKQDDLCLTKSSFWLNNTTWLVITCAQARFLFIYKIIVIDVVKNYCPDIVSDHWLTVFRLSPLLGALNFEGCDLSLIFKTWETHIFSTLL